MAKRRRSLSPRLMGVVPKTASKASRPDLPQTSDIATLRAYLNRWALVQLRRELRSHPERFGEPKARILDQMTHDDRPLEDKIAEEEFERNPRFRAATLRLYLEKKWQELGISYPTIRSREESADEGYHEGREDELTQFAKQYVIDQLENS